MEKNPIYISKDFSEKFNEYKLRCELYIGGKDDSKRCHESHNNDRWEYVVSLSPSQEFQQISFVNGIFTSKGGKHVDYILNQITKKMIQYNKSCNLRNG